MFKIITLLIVGAFLYRMLHRYVLPIFYMSANAEDRLKDMQKQMREMNRKLEKRDRTRRKEEDFIDYEEVK